MEILVLSAPRRSLPLAPAGRIKGPRILPLSIGLAPVLYCAVCTRYEFRGHPTLAVDFFVHTLTSPISENWEENVG